MNRLIDGDARVLRMAAALSLFVLLPACTTIGPNAWEKDLMAKKPMLLTANSSVRSAESHIYFSKEGASGGSGTAGGGCGCN